eukprot:m51a1_g448 hypothetical protein (527) ;mRNA; f:119979-122989
MAMGIGAVLAVGVLSGFSSVFLEWILKDASHTSLFECNLQLALCSLVPAIISCIAFRGFPDVLRIVRFQSGATVAIVLLSAVGGILVAGVTKLLDSIAKCFTAEETNDLLYFCESFKPDMNDEQAAMPSLKDRIASLLPALVAMRRDLHQHPESAFKEFRTSSEVRRMLRELAGVPEEAMRAVGGGTGIVVDVRGQGPAAAAPRTILLRADMDALTMTEHNDALPYRSLVDGHAHMCGHDGHTAVMVGTVALVCEAAQRLPSNACIRFVFQPAEEAAGGAAAVAADGVLQGIDEAYALHALSTGVGNIRVVLGPTMSQITVFEVEILGKGGHGSNPQLCVDPIVCACQTISALQTIVSRNVSPLDNAVLTVAMVNGGEAVNVIPDKVRFSGTMRTFTPGVFETMSRRFREVVNGTCAAFGCTATVSMHTLSSAVVNTADAVDSLTRACARVAEVRSVSNEGLPLMASEDFSVFADAAKTACLWYLGISGSESLHSPNFNFDDEAIPIALQVWTRLIEDRLGVVLYD